MGPICRVGLTLHNTGSWIRFRDTDLRDSQICLCSTFTYVKTLAPISPDCKQLAIIRYKLWDKSYLLLSMRVINKHLWQSHNPWRCEKGRVGQCSSSHELHQGWVRPTLVPCRCSPMHVRSSRGFQKQVAQAIEHLQIQSLGFGVGLRWGKLSGQGPTEFHI